MNFMCSCQRIFYKWRIVISLFTGQVPQTRGAILTKKGGSLKGVDACVHTVCGGRLGALGKVLEESRNGGGWGVWIRTRQEAVAQDLEICNSSTNFWSLVSYKVRESLPCFGSVSSLQLIYEHPLDFPNFSFKLCNNSRGVATYTKAPWSSLEIKFLTQDLIMALQVSQASNSTTSSGVLNFPLICPNLVLVINEVTTPWLLHER